MTATLRNSARHRRAKAAAPAKLLGAAAMGVRRADAAASRRLVTALAAVVVAMGAISSSRCGSRHQAISSSSRSGGRHLQRRARAAAARAEGHRRGKMCGAPARGARQERPPPGYGRGPMQDRPPPGYGRGGPMQDRAPGRGRFDDREGSSYDDRAPPGRGRAGRWTRRKRDSDDEDEVPPANEQFLSPEDVEEYEAEQSRRRRFAAKGGRGKKLEDFVRDKDKDKEGKLPDAETIRKRREANELRGRALPGRSYKTSAEILAGRRKNKAQRRQAKRDRHKKPERVCMRRLLRK